MCVNIVNLNHMCLMMQHAALSEYRPILAASPLSNSLSSMADRKLTLIPIIFIVLRIWSTIRFILMLVDSPARQNPVLVTLHVSSVTVELPLIMLIYNIFDCSSFSIFNPVLQPASTQCPCVFRALEILSRGQPTASCLCCVLNPSAHACSCCCVAAAVSAERDPLSRSPPPTGEPPAGRPTPPLVSVQISADARMDRSEGRDNVGEAKRR